MGELFYRDKQFIYMERERERVLLDCGKFLTNRSRIPMHCLENQNIRTIPDVLADLIERGPWDGNDMRLGTALIDVLLAACLIRTSQPVRMLEYGCGGGKLSCHLAAVLGEFCEESSLVCACDAMDMEWMNRISEVEKLPRISFLAGDYGHLQLQQSYFDFILINGTVNFADPDQVVSDALKLASENGRILCCCNDTPLLDDVFRLYFEDDKREDYGVSPSVKLMWAMAKDSSWKTWEEEQDFDSQAREHLRQAADMLQKGSIGRREAAKAAGRLLEDARTAGAKGKVNLKIELLRQKEALLSCSRKQL